MLRKERIVVALCLLLGCGSDDGGDGQVCQTTTSPPDVSGTWVLSDPTLGSTTCPDQIAESVVDALAMAGPCPFEVEQSGNDIVATDCGGEPITGCVDDAGIITATVFSSASEGGCTLTANIRFIADSGESVSTVALVYPLRFRGNCIVSACDLVVDAEWTREVGSPASAAFDRKGSRDQGIEGSRFGESGLGFAAVLRGVVESSR